MFMTIHIKHQHFQVTKTYAVFISESLKPQNITSPQINQIKQQKTWPNMGLLPPQNFHTDFPKIGHIFQARVTFFPKTIHFWVSMRSFSVTYILLDSPQKMGNASFPLVETYGTPGSPRPNKKWPLG